MVKAANFRLPEEILEALKARADADMRTQTATLIMILRESLTKSGHLEKKQ